MLWTAAGYVGGESDISNVADNTLTFNGRALPYDKFLFGGITFGSGNVTGNKIFVNQVGAPLTSSVDAVHGGVASGGGSAENNHVEFSGNNLNSDLGGGTTERTGTGIVRGNTVTLKGGNKTAAGNTLNVNTSARVGTIGNFSTVIFKNASSKLALTQAGVNIDLDTIKADFAATEREDVLVENANGQKSFVHKF